MRNANLHLMAVTVAFVTGVTCNSVWMHVTGQTNDRSNGSPISGTLIQENVSSEGVEQFYEMSDHSMVHSVCYNLESSEGAVDELGRKTWYQQGIISNEAYLDQYGHIGGKRIIAMDTEPIAHWTHANTLCKASARSLPALQWRLAR